MVCTPCALYNISYNNKVWTLYTAHSLVDCNDMHFLRNVNLVVYLLNNPKNVDLVQCQMRVIVRQLCLHCYSLRSMKSMLVMFIIDQFSVDFVFKCVEAISVGSFGESESLFRFVVTIKG